MKGRFIISKRVVKQKHIIQVKLHSIKVKTTKHCDWRDKTMLTQISKAAATIENKQT